MQPILLTSKRQSTGISYQKYVDAEDRAIAAAGFERVEIEVRPPFDTPEPPANLINRPVVFRHYVHEHSYLAEYAKKAGMVQAIPGYQQANDWFKLLPIDFMARDWFGGRNIDWRSLKPYGYLEKQEQVEALRKMVSRLYVDYGVKGKIFAKSSHKDSFDAGIYNKAQLLEQLTWLLGVGGHRIPSELIVSQPVTIKRYPTVYGVEEYRCIVVNSMVVSVSLYTDLGIQREYDEIYHFAQRFAHAFKYGLPNSYDLDIARLDNNKLAVVELNDIAGCGWFADHNLPRIFGALYRLSQKTK